MKELFTEEEVNRIKSLFSHYRGVECHFDKDRLALLEHINALPVGEIAVDAEILPGYQVLFIFKNKVEISQASFAIYNKCPEIIRGHKNLNAREKNAVLTNKYMRGNWVSEDSTIWVSIDKTSLVMVKENVKQTLDCSGEWYGEYFRFREGNVFMKYANENSMELGVLKSAVEPEQGHIWEKTFTRIRDIRRN